MEKTPTRAKPCSPLSDARRLLATKASASMAGVRGKEDEAGGDRSQ